MTKTLIRTQTVFPKVLDDDIQLPLFDAESATNLFFLTPYSLPAQRTTFAPSDFSILLWQSEWTVDPSSVGPIDRAAQLSDFARWSINGMGLDLEHLEDIEHTGWDVSA
jgi:hypothetical protein